MESGETFGVNGIIIRKHDKQPRVKHISHEIFDINIKDWLALTWPMVYIDQTLHGKSNMEKEILE